MSASPDHRILGREAAKAEFAMARSQSIDAFAKLEVTVIEALGRLGIAQNRDCLGRRVEALGKAKASPSLPKADLPKMADWAERTHPFLAQRASLVHAEMELGQFGGHWRAVFANAIDAATGMPTVMMFTVADLNRLQRSVHHLTVELSKLVKGVPVP
jgi:hypothetical protein